MYNDALYVRLHTCLQTILELEPTFSENTFENCAELKELFTMLKDSLGQLDKVSYESEDVERIERSVAVFDHNILDIICKILGIKRNHVIPFHNIADRNTLIDQT